MTLPVESKKRKEYPLHSGCFKYFPAALAGVSNLSKLGNNKHNCGQPLHHARDKSTDHLDCVMRHIMDTTDLLAAKERGEKINEEELLIEVNSIAWRALAYAQQIHEELGSPMAPGAKLNKVKK